MTALTKAVAWIVISEAFLGGPVQAADKTALGHQIADAMIDIARHGNLHDVAYTQMQLPIPFTLMREASPQSSASGAAIHYYEPTLTRAQRGMMAMSYLVAIQGTLDPESSGTLTSYLSLSNLDEYACVTADMVTSQLGLDERPQNDGPSRGSQVVALYQSDFTKLWLSYTVNRTGCFDHLGIAQRNLPEPSYQMPKVTRCPTVGECKGSED